MFCQRDELKKQARQLLRDNHREGYSQQLKRNYSYTCPSPEAYPFQWFWDSCFHAIALSHLDLEQAKRELLSLVSVQEESGFCPHIILWEKPEWKYTLLNVIQGKNPLRPSYTALIQPPVLAFATLKVVEKDKGDGFLKEILPKIKRYYLWLLENRDPDKDNLISIISPYESGLDYKPAYDEVLDIKEPTRLSIFVAPRMIELRNLFLGHNLKKIFFRDHFNVEDVLVNVTLAQSLWALAKLCRFNKEGKESEKFERLAQNVEAAILTKCQGEDGLFYDLYSQNEVMVKVKTFTSLLPILLKTIDKTVVDNLVRDHLLNTGEFWLPYPVPSVAKSEPTFKPGKGPLWRGPTWINTNWFLVYGLWQHGYKEIACQIVEKSCALIQKSGFREYYNPLTGRGYGAHNFGWSTLIVDMIELVEDGKIRKTGSN
ncbi:MAG: trehalase-like protein [bacterium]|nr:trehalase-like protein [bacterium]